MSLINDALKKAQRQRGEDSGYMPPMPGGGGGGVRKRGAPMPAQTIALIVAGGVILLGITIGVTVWLLRPKTSAPAAPAATVAKVEPAAPKAAAPVATPVPAPIAPANPTSEKPSKPIEFTIPKPAPAPAPVEPVATAPASSEQPAPRPESRPASAATAPVATAPTPTSVATAPENPRPTHNAAATTHLALPDERVQVYLDALRVTGIRSSGTDSKVLMNEKVFRVNDIVDRNLGLRLTKVQADGLTFTDANGVVYVKNF